MKPGVAEVSERAAIHRNLNLYPIVRRRQHKRFALQLDRLHFSLERRRLPKNRVVATQIAANRPNLRQRYAKQTRLGPRHNFVFFVVARSRVSLDRTLRPLSNYLAFIRTTLCIFPEHLCALQFAGRTKW